GIRAKLVTGVQTCALPISLAGEPGRYWPFSHAARRGAVALRAVARRAPATAPGESLRLARAARRRVAAAQPATERGARAVHRSCVQPTVAWRARDRARLRSASPLGEPRVVSAGGGRGLLGEGHRAGTPDHRRRVGPSAAPSG